MSEFINTIDLLGDDVVMDSIIDRTITEFKDDQITVVGNNAFQKCAALKTVILPSATAIGNDALRECSSLEEISFPNVTSLEGRAGGISLRKISLPKVTATSPYAYHQCTALTTVDLPSIKNINFYTFAECSALRTLNFPVLEGISNDVFRACTALMTVDLPNVKSISNNAFINCSVLNIIILRRMDTVATIGNTNVFKGTPIASGTGYIYVPRALVDSYKAATNWSTYATQFRALEDYTVDGTTTGELDETKI